MRNCRIACKGLLLIYFLAAHSLNSQAQERCATRPTNVEEFELWLSQKMEEGRSKPQALRIASTVYEIPVVIHVIEPASGNSLNIPDERIFRQIEVLTEDFRRQNADSVNTPPLFRPVAADVRIQFVPARQDPDGNPTNGIVRATGGRNRYNPILVSHKAELRQISFWPPAHYLNIYVTDLSGFLGFASFPVTELPGITNGIDDFIFDGVLIDYEYFGENPNASAFESFGRTTTHEVGHYLGLRHIWGDGGCLVDDFVDDTPLADESNDGLGSPCTFPNPDDQVVCVPGEDEMFQNYMDYTNDVCMNIFTLGQTARMRTVMENSPRRLSLISSPGLIAPPRFEDDLAFARINTPQDGECVNQIVPSVDIVNYGLNEVTSYEIELRINGTTRQIINQNTTLDSFQVETINFTPEFINDTPSEMEFVITSVNNNEDPNSANNSKTRMVVSTNTLFIPYSEDFESEPNVYGKIGSGEAWEIRTAAKSTAGNKALTFKAFQNNTSFGDNTIIKTPILNLTGLPTADIIFSRSHAQLMDGFWDGLTVKVSTDCGQTFPHTVFSEFGSTLATIPAVVGSFVPSNENEWLTDTLNVATIAAGVDGVQVAFIAENGGGNNIYLDDISVVQLDRNANDVSLLSIDGPLATCSESTNIEFEVLNIGFEPITSLSYQYGVNGTQQTITETDLTLDPGKTQRFRFEISLNDGSNDLQVTVTEVNGVPDEDLSNNSAIITVNRDQARDSYPLIVDFERPNTWTKNPADNIPIWSNATVNGNGTLLANGFTQAQLGAEDWFISPELLVGNLDTAGLSFKVSYASRPGFTDQLRVLMSIDCGENYQFELFSATSDSLAVVESAEAWSPASDADWKEIQIDLQPSIVWRDEIRLAFVFTNGNGNNLFLDDINIGYKPVFDSEENSFVVFPNPAKEQFNVAFDFAQRSSVDMQIIDLSGRVIFETKYDNVLDQVYDFFAPAQSGFYFVKVIGNNINQTERIYIRQ